MDAAPALIEGTRLHDLGDGFMVRRMLPVLLARHVGPFVFYDHMGPVTFAAGNGMNVRPHPHIGLATVTWLFDGVIRHRDSIGSLADIHPGAVNWMTAGHGIAHSERTPPEARQGSQLLHGIQVWVALPQADAEVAPEFHHHDSDALPRIRQSGVEAVLIAGTAYGERSPVKVFAPMFFLEVRLEAGAELALPPEHAERGVHVVEGAVRWGELEIGAQQMAVQAGPSAPTLRAHEASRLMLFGGAPLDGERHLWWNFVASTRERIEQAKADWREGRFPKVAGDDKEFIPLPE
ncbi:MULTISPECIES: pirin family protein [Rhodanobacter]|uniref:pirin family protein n=1 Tax=Rhodanobacter TaxID=75309 RepID=UPI00040BA872|nr:MULTISPECIES: pirin family protein [Rhodanobacter]TAN16239.1 MAG: pirin family protein [Rhodanobacter sp.]UJJ54024.1 pirin family protein [Rhodanobacter thiooxydans]